MVENVFSYVFNCWSTIDSFKKNILKVEYLKKYKVFKKSEKKRAIPSYSEYLKNCM